VKVIARIFGLTLFLFSLNLVGQSKADAAKTNEVTAKDTPASQTLVQMAKQKADDQKVFEAKVSQAKANLDSTNKPLGEKLVAVNNELTAKLKADKNYKSYFEQIASLQKEMSDNNQKAQQAFSVDAGVLQGRVNSESIQIEGLIPIVRKENGFSDSVTFDAATGKWSEKK
jgi:hypothetical protein